MASIRLLNARASGMNTRLRKASQAKLWTWASAVAAVCSLIVSGAAGTGYAQQTATAIEVLEVRSNFYMIAGAGGNIGVQVGGDGVMLVNAGAQETSDQVLATIEKLTDQPVRYIIATSADADIVGGTAALSKVGQHLTVPPIPRRSRAARRQAGVGAATETDAARVFAHERVLFRMSRGVGGGEPPFPSDGWPSEYFSERRAYMYFNDEGIEILHQPAAHTDGDSIIFFRRSDVVVAGHILDTTRFPVIDTANGGSIQGEIRALNRLIELAIPPGPHLGTPSGPNVTSPQPGGTEVIPGRGRIYRQLDLVNYRDMVVIIRDEIAELIKRNMTLEQIQAARPAKVYERQYGATTGPWTTTDFVAAIYHGLTSGTSMASLER